VKPKVEPPTNRTEETFEWRGVTLKTWMSPGQVINKEKLYKKYIRENPYKWTSK
jgi:hypothetical protein